MRYERPQKRNFNYKKEEEEYDEEEELDNFEESEMEENEENQDEEVESQEESDDDSENIIYRKDEEVKVSTNDEDIDEDASKDDKASFNSHINNIRSGIDTLNTKLSGLLTSFKSNKAETKYGISYLDTKNNMMLLYLSNLIFYSLSKASGDRIEDNSVVKKLIYLKTLLEKSKVIDLKLKSQIDRLVKISEKEANGETTTSSNNLEEQNLKVSQSIFYDFSQTF